MQYYLHKIMKKSFTYQHTKSPPVTHTNLGHNLRNKIPFITLKNWTR